MLKCQAGSTHTGSSSARYQIAVYACKILALPWVPSFSAWWGSRKKEGKLVVEVTCDLEISAICSMTIVLGTSMGVPLCQHKCRNAKMHNFMCNCKPVVWGFSLRPDSSHPHFSVIQKSSHLWDPSSHHRKATEVEEVEKCHLQVEHHQAQWITDVCEWLFLHSRGVPTLHRHPRSQVDVDTWKVKAIKKSYLVSCPGPTKTDGRFSQGAHGLRGTAHGRGKRY